MVVVATYWTKDAVERLRTLYPDRSITIEEIADGLGKTVRAITSKAREIGVNRFHNTKDHFWTEEENMILTDLYPDSTLSVRQIAERLNRPFHSTKMHAARLGLRRIGRYSPPREIVERMATCLACRKKFVIKKFSSAEAYKYCCRKCHYDDARGIDDETTFSSETPEVAYWAGFLMADGCVTESTVILTLSSKDEGHIESFRSFIGCSNPIHQYKKRMASGISVRSARMASDLGRWGVVPRKTYVGAIPNDIPAHLLHHYIRGLIDGDGGVHIRSYTQGKYSGIRWSVELCGNDAIITRVYEILSELGIRASKFPSKRSKVSDHITYSVCVTKKADVRRLVEWLGYGKDDPSLPRKTETARAILSVDPAAIRH